jgi:hypothetical protein
MGKVTAGAAVSSHPRSFFGNHQVPPETDTISMTVPLPKMFFKNAFILRNLLFAARHCLLLPHLNSKVLLTATKILYETWLALD